MNMHLSVVDVGLRCVSV